MDLHFSYKDVSKPISFATVSHGAAIAIVVATAVIMVAFAATAFPLTKTDAKAYLSPAISYARGEGLTTTVFQTAARVDPELRLIYHGFLNQIFVGVLAPSPEVYWVPFVSQFLNAIIVLLMFFYLRGALLKHSAMPSWAAWGAVTAACLTTAALMCSKIGRPEEFGLLIVLVSLLLAQAYPKREYVIHAIGLGMLIATTPVLGAALSFVLVAYIAYQHPARAAWTNSVLAAVIATVVFLGLIVVVYPYPIGDWVHGMIIHSQTAALNTFFSSGYVTYYITHPEFPLFAIPALLSAALIALWLARNIKNVKHMPLFIIGVAGFLLVFVGQGISWGDRIYSWFPVLPFLYLPIVLAFASLGKFGKERAPSWLIGGAQAACVGLLAIPALGFVRMVLLFPIYLTVGVGLADASQEANRVYAETTGQIRTTDSLFVLFDDWDRLEIQNYHPRQMYDPEELNMSYRTGEPYEVLVLQQNLSGARTAPIVPGYELVANNFIEECPRLFSIPIGNTIPGYQFAVYKRLGAGRL